MNSDRARPILERLAFVIYLWLFVGSCGLTGLGLLFAVLLGNPQPLLIGCGGSVLTAMIREVGYRQWHFKKWEESLEKMRHHETMLNGASFAADASELERVLEELGELDSMSPSESRDVWKVQHLRHRAKTLLEREPSLRREFCRELARHPEIG